MQRKFQNKCLTQISLDQINTLATLHDNFAILVQLFFVRSLKLSLYMKPLKSFKLPDTLDLVTKLAIVEQEESDFFVSNGDFFAPPLLHVHILRLLDLGPGQQVTQLALG